MSVDSRSGRAVVAEHIARERHARRQARCRDLLAARATHLLADIDPLRAAPLNLAPLNLDRFPRLADASGGAAHQARVMGRAALTDLLLRGAGAAELIVARVDILGNPSR